MTDVRTSTSIAFFTFIPWFVTLMLLDSTRPMTHEWTTLFQYALITVLFIAAFSVYSKSQKQINAYETALISGIWVLVFEAVIFFLKPAHQIYNFANWIMPLFLIVFVVYGVGIFFNSKKTRH